MEFRDYRHSMRIQIRFSDIDRLNHVNNACYLTYFESARVSYFQQLFGKQVDWSKTGFVIARSEIDHIKSIYLEDEVYCFTRVIRLGNKSMTVKNTIAKRENNRWIICADGIGVLVAMDYTTRQSMRVPNVWRELIAEFEGKELSR